MRVKRKLHLAVVDRIKGHTSVDLIEKCPDLRQTYPLYPCTNGACDYKIREPGYMNCSFVAGEAGEHTLEAIGEMMNMTREGVRLIEVRALKKFRALWDVEGDAPVHEPSLAAGPH